MDQTIRIWDLKQPSYEDDPIILYDHEDEIVSADIRPSDGLFASMDIQGTVLIRSLKDLSDAESVLYVINTIPKDVEDYSKILLNVERADIEGEIIVLINDQLILLDI